MQAIPAIGSVMVMLINQGGAYINSSRINDEQKTEIQKLSAAHQAEMDVLRTELRSTSNLNQRKMIRGQMDQIQAAHRKNIIELAATPGLAGSTLF